MGGANLPRGCARQTLKKQKRLAFPLKGSVMASDAFLSILPIVWRSRNNNGVIETVIQPGGSVRDRDSINQLRQPQYGYGDRYPPLPALIPTKAK